MLAFDLGHRRLALLAMYEQGLLFVEAVQEVRAAVQGRVVLLNEHVADVLRRNGDCRRSRGRSGCGSGICSSGRSSGRGSDRSSGAAHIRGRGHEPCAFKADVYVVGGRVYWGSACGKRRFEWLVDAARGLQRALAAAAAPSSPPVPDVRFVLSIYDWPLCTRASRLPCFEVTGTPDHSAILVPGYAFHGYAPRKIAQATEVPWADKAERGYFRGTLNCYDDRNLTTCVRARMWRHAQTRPELLDVGLTRFRRASRNGFEDLVPATLTPAPKTSLPEHARFKYLLQLDGQTFAYRLQQLLPIGSAVFKHTSPYREFYYHLLVPYEHYIPFEVTPEGTDIDARLQWARQHDAVVRRIAQAGQALADTFLAPACIHCYWRTLLTEYAALQNFTVVLPSTAVPV